MTIKTAIASLLVGGALAAGAPLVQADTSNERKAKDRIEDRAEAAKDKTQAQADAEKKETQNRADAEKNRIDERAEVAKDRMDTKVADKNVDKKGKEPSAGDDVSDAWITTKLKAQYTTESAFKNASIKVDTENRGHVRLQGTVPTETARAKALEVARSTKGVRDVKDDLIVGVKK
jgi:osmotically-inducible protein OsmY